MADAREGRGQRRGWRREARAARAMRVAWPARVAERACRSRCSRTAQQARCAASSCCGESDATPSESSSSHSASSEPCTASSGPGLCIPCIACSYTHSYHCATSLRSRLPTTLRQARSARAAASRTAGLASRTAVHTWLKTSRMCTKSRVGAFSASSASTKQAACRWRDVSAGCSFCSHSSERRSSSSTDSAAMLPRTRASRPSTRAAAASPSPSPVPRASWSRLEKAFKASLSGASSYSSGSSSYSPLLANMAVWPPTAIEGYVARGARL